MPNEKLHIGNSTTNDNFIKVFMHFDFYQQTKVFGLLV